MDVLQQDGAVFDECTRTIVKQVEELKKMVNEFSNFARMPASEPAPNHLNEIIQETLVLFQEAHKNVRFEFVAQDLPVFNIDRDQMKRVMINLIKNSLAAIDEGGGDQDPDRVTTRSSRWFGWRSATTAAESLTKTREGFSSRISPRGRPGQGWG